MVVACPRIIAMKLCEFCDVNEVTFFVNPDHIVRVTVNRPRRWEATFILTNGEMFVIDADEFETLHDRLVDGLK
jgi:hypothetical protein